MKARWRGREVRLTLGFVLALVLGGRMDPPIVNQNVSGTMAGFGAADYSLVIDEGRRQIDSQSERFKHATDRAQTTLTIGLIVLGFVAGIFQRANNADDWHRAVGLALWFIASCLSVSGIAAAASVIVVRADFMRVDTTQMTHWASPIQQQLAADYAEAVVLGESTIAARVNVFRQATRLVAWGAVVAATSYIVSRAL